jgi:hypothetical protein
MDEMKQEPVCDRMWDLLSLYADGEASADERILVEDHLRKCPACAKELETLRNTSLLFSSVPAVDPPAYLRQAILDATVNKPHWLTRFTPPLRFLISPSPAIKMGLGSAAAIAAAWMFLMTRPSVSPAPGYASSAVRSYYHGQKSIAAINTPPKIQFKLHNAEKPAEVASIHITRKQKKSVLVHRASLEQSNAILDNEVANRPVVHHPSALMGSSVSPSMNPEIASAPTGTPDTVTPSSSTGTVVVSPSPVIASNTITDQPSVSRTATVHLRIVAGPPEINTSSISTLADLRKSIQRSNETRLRDDNSPSGISGHHEVYLDVIKTRF